MTALLEMTAVCAAYGRGPRVLNDVSLAVAPGEVIGVLGMNGAGKSTLIRTIDGELPHTSGTVLVDGVKYRSQPVSERVRRGIVALPEGHRVIQPLTVQENLELSTLRLGRQAVRRVLAERLPLIHEMFPILRERKDQLAGLLSGGEQQMLSLGRALMADPRLLLLDEPSLGLAPAVVGRIYEVLPALAERGIAVLIVEQSPLRLQRACSHIVILREGSITAELSAGELNDEVLRGAYFGHGN